MMIGSDSESNGDGKSPLQWDIGKEVMGRMEVG